MEKIKDLTIRGLYTDTPQVEQDISLIPTMWNDLNKLKLKTEDLQKQIDALP
jgi:hypothetical protein